MVFIDSLLQGIPINAVLREKLDLVKQKYNELEIENQKLNEHVSALKTENGDLKKQLAAFQVEQKFIQQEGVLWKKEPNGKYLPYCPICKTVLSPIPPQRPDFLTCTQCNFDAPFHPNQVSNITASLPM
jgi:FtsZ-binding cell division protein ZapB